MSLLLRFAFFLTLAGFALGLLLRRVRPERTPEAVALAALPWVVHLIYAFFWAVGTPGAGASLGSVVFGLLDVVLGAAVLRFGPSVYRRDARRAALVPLALLASHLLVLSVWALLPEVSFLPLPVLYFVGATFFVASGLLSYGVPLPRGLVRRR